jgi:hypothetical protein
MHPVVLYTDCAEKINVKFTIAGRLFCFIGLAETTILSFVSSICWSIVQGLALYAMSEVGGSIAYRVEEPDMSTASHKEYIDPATMS